jgi:hypothetical protein
MSASALPSYLVQLTPYILFGAARDEDQVELGTHNAFGDASCTPVACVSRNGETFLAGVVATDLATEHGGTDVNKRDGARQRGRLNVADLPL